MQVQDSEIKEFQNKIFTWFTKNQRDLPWRRTRDPYHILVSEIMLQQTQVNRVIPKYEAWFKAFPTIHDLSRASISEVLRLWSGLGYNRRALYLQKAAKVIVETYDGKFPNDQQLLRQLPGIGKYTAAAVACFAFDKQVAVVDTNVCKIILTQFAYRFKNDDLKIKKGEKNLNSYLSIRDSDNSKSLFLSDKEIDKIADKLLPKGKAYEWNQALMDYASEMLKKEKIPLPKQSKFIGSNRYYRGQIIKLLIREKTITLQKLKSIFKKDLQFTDEDLLEKIIDQLVKDQLIQRNQNEIYLPD